MLDLYWSIECLAVTASLHAITKALMKGYMAAARVTMTGMTHVDLQQARFSPFKLAQSLLGWLHTYSSHGEERMIFYSWSGQWLQSSLCSAMRSP